MAEMSRLDREAVWLPLLSRLSGSTDSWLAYKNVGSALTGTGDVDSSASPREWDELIRQHAQWSLALGPRVVCSHIPGGINMVTVVKQTHELLEVGVKERKTFRGSTFFYWSQLVPLARKDHRGFRRLRQGAEGFIKLILKLVEHTGSPNRDGIARKGVLGDIVADQEGANLAARSLFWGHGSRASVRLLSAVLAGGWDRSAAKAIQRGAYLRAVAEPGVAVGRAWFQLKKRSRCPVTNALLFHDRQIPGDPDLWWPEVMKSHPSSSDPW